MNMFFEVFSTWDDQYDKLHNLMKQKRIELLKMVWRVNPAHKHLHARLEQIRK